MVYQAQVLTFLHSVQTYCKQKLIGEAALLVLATINFGDFEIKVVFVLN